MGRFVISGKLTTRLAGVNPDIAGMAHLMEF
jgi:hypothetical protein